MAGGGPVAIFLHLNHFLFAVITVVALHWNGYLYDYGKSKAQQNMAKLHEQYDKMADREKEEFDEEYKIYCTGMIWGIMVVLFGIIALVVFIASFLVKLPKPIQWYYLTVAILILFFASLGLGVSRGVDDYGKCMKETTMESDGEIVQEMSKEAKDCYSVYWSGVKTFSFNFFIFVISFQHSMTYVASFLMTFFGESSSSSGLGSSSGGGDNQQDKEQAAPDQQVLEQQAREQKQITAATSTTKARDVEAAKS